MKAYIALRTSLGVAALAAAAAFGCSRPPDDASAKSASTPVAARPTGPAVANTPSASSARVESRIASARTGSDADSTASMPVDAATGSAESSPALPEVTLARCDAPENPCAIARGFPALSSDASRVAIAYQTNDGGRGWPNLSIRIYSVDGAQQIGVFAVFGSDELEPILGRDSPDTVAVAALEKRVKQRIASARAALRSRSYRAMTPFEQAGVAATFDAQTNQLVVKSCAAGSHNPTDCLFAPDGGAPLFQRPFDPATITLTIGAAGQREICSAMGASPIVEGAIDRKRKIAVLLPQLITGDLCEVDNPVRVHRF